MAANYYEGRKKRNPGTPYREVGSGKYVWQFIVHSEAHLDEWLKDYFGGINITHEKNSRSVLTGVLTDISALYGLIMKLRDSGISVISLQAERKTTTERR